MYITQFIKREKPNFSKTNDQQPWYDIKSMTQSFFYKTTDTPVQTTKTIQHREYTSIDQKSRN